jgi:hypothetical protein
MNSFNQTNFNERDNNYNNQISLNKSEKFQDAVNNMRLMMWNRFLAGVVSNPHMTKKEVCHHLGLKVGTINSIQHYKLQSPFYFKKPKAHRKQKQESESDKSLDEQSDNSTSVVKSKAKNKKGLKGGGETYDFEDTFNKTVESLRN